VVVEAKESLKFADLVELRKQEEKDVDALLKRYAMDQRAFMIKRRKEFEYTVSQLYETLDLLSIEMDNCLKKKKLEGRSKLDELLKVF